MPDDRAAIRDVITRYALSLDAGEIDRCVELFADNAEFQVYGRTFTGHDSIGDMFREAPHGLHLTGVSLIDVDPDVTDTATARSQVLFVRAGDLHLRPAVYDDELVRHDGQWRFRRRQCRFVTTSGLSDSPEV